MSNHDTHQKDARVVVIQNQQTGTERFSNARNAEKLRMLMQMRVSTLHPLRMQSEAL